MEQSSDGGVPVDTVAAVDNQTTIGNAPVATARRRSTTPQPPSTSQTSSKRKRKKRASKPHILTQITLRNPQWSYIHLQHLHSGQSEPGDIDAVTAHMHLNAALTQFLGLHGSAIAFDILKLEKQDVWIRLAGEDQSALVAAVGGWVNGSGEGWRVKGWSSWNAVVAGKGQGQDLFSD